MILIAVAGTISTVEYEWQYYGNCYTAATAAAMAATTTTTTTTTIEIIQVSLESSTIATIAAIPNTTPKIIQTLRAFRRADLQAP